MTQLPLNKRGGEASKFQVRLNDDQMAWLRVLSESTGVTPSEFIRTTIDLARQSGDPDPVGAVRRALDFTSVYEQLGMVPEDDAAPPGGSTAAA